MTDKEFKQLFTNSKELTPRAELKNEILEKAKLEMSSKKAARPRSLKRILAPIAACFVFAVLSVVIFASLRAESYQTVYIDVNPSVELQINRFGKVNEVVYHNTDAEEALDGVKIKWKSAESALEAIISAFDTAGYFDTEAELYISALDKNGKTDDLLEELSECAEKIKGNKKYNVNTSKVTKEMRETAKAEGIAPGRYKVIAAIMEEYPEYTLDELRDKSMSELKDLLPKANDKNDKNDKDKNDKNNKK